MGETGKESCDPVSISNLEKFGPVEVLEDKEFYRRLSELKHSKLIIRLVIECIALVEIYSRS